RRSRGALRRMRRDPGADQRVRPAPAEARGVTGAQRGGWTTSAHEPTRVILLRHGQTPASVQRLYSGRGNPSLTDLGREQAAEAA
ncbi:histidine phosphatase family protein, partial [Mycobacterium kansasii]